MNPYWNHELQQAREPGHEYDHDGAWMGSGATPGSGCAHDLNRCRRRDRLINAAALTLFLIFLIASITLVRYLSAS